MPRRNGLKNAESIQSVPDVYRDMLADANSSPVQSDADGRSIKKRRVAGRLVTHSQLISNQPSGENRESGIDDLFEERAPIQQQIVQSESEDSADSDVNWEEVDLKGVSEDEASSGLDPQPEELNLVLGEDKQRLLKPERRKGKIITGAERKLRLEVHKMHLCCLLVHVYIRNSWCNDQGVQLSIRKLLNKRMISYLNPNETKTQFERSRSFIDGLQQASEVLRSYFRITSRGMAKAQWRDRSSLNSLQIPNDIDLPLQKEDFASSANDLKGSRDTGAQIFCAMLRAAGVDARLVCSLQPLQFRAVEKTNTAQRQYAVRMPVQPETRAMMSELNSADEERVQPLAPIGSSGGQNRFTSDSAEDAATRLANRPNVKKSIRESKYPVFWVEAFNEAIQKWVPVDPLVTQTIAKPSKFEPPAGERENSLTYVIAFEDDGTARDVTRRYAKAHNAKTRRDRIESTQGGMAWWKKAMKMFEQRGQSLDRDQLEDAELRAKEAAEPMPRNVQDFKDHPYYALERHLRRHEVIHPRREVGKVGTGGKGHNSLTLEPVFRRSDVLRVQSADKWYRMGRSITAGEQPLKRVAARRKRQESVNADDDQDEMNDNDHAGTGLYSLDQTIVYKPSPVKNNQIPKNAYGNLDIYVPSMIPAGGAHIQHRETARVARILGINYADAITGFTFKGRHGTAVNNGAVVAAEHVEAVLEVIQALEDERAILEQETRTAKALATWKRLLVGLRIRERIEGYEVEGEREKGEAMRRSSDDDGTDEEGGGGFFPGADAGPAAEPTVVARDYSSRSSHAAESPVGEPEAVILQPKPTPLQITVVYGERIRSREPSPSDTSPVHKRARQQEDLFADEFAGEKEEGGGGGFLDDEDDDDRADEAALQSAIAATLPNPHSSKAAAAAADKQETVNLEEGRRSPEKAGKASLLEEEEGGSGVDGNEGFPLQQRLGVIEGDHPIGNNKGDVGLDNLASGGNELDKNDDKEDDEEGSLLSHDPEDEEADVDWMD